MRLIAPIFSQRRREDYAQQIPLSLRMGLERDTFSQRMGLERDTFSQTRV